MTVVFLREDLESVLIKHSCDWKYAIIKPTFESFLRDYSHLDALCDPFEALMGLS